MAAGDRMVSASPGAHRGRPSEEHTSSSPFSREHAQTRCSPGSLQRLRRSDTSFDRGSSSISVVAVNGRHCRSEWSVPGNGRLSWSPLVVLVPGNGCPWRCWYWEMALGLAEFEPITGTKGSFRDHLQGPTIPTPPSTGTDEPTGTGNWPLADGRYRGMVVPGGAGARELLLAIGWCRLAQGHIEAGRARNRSRQAERGTHELQPIFTRTRSNSM